MYVFITKNVTVGYHVGLTYSAISKLTGSNKKQVAIRVEQRVVVTLMLILYFFGYLVNPATALNSHHDGCKQCASSSVTM
jgi:hypothetical protein